MSAPITSLAEFLATGCGVGYLPTPGTCGTVLLGLPLLFFLRYMFPQSPEHPFFSIVTFLGVVIVVNILAIRIVHYALPHLQAQHHSSDPQVIVLDEIAGLLLVFVGVPLTPTTVAVGTLLFRILDITKLGPIGWSEQLPGALGIVIDDSLAGAIACIILHGLMLLRFM